MSNTIEELQAWREIMTSEFDFGDGCIGSAEYSFIDDYIYCQEIEELMYKETFKKNPAASGKSHKKSKRTTDQQRMARQYKRYNGSTSPFIWYYKDKGLYGKSYMSATRRHCKLQTNRRIRHCKEKIPNKSFYHKMFDYWWELF